MTLLIIGLVLFIGVHSIKITAPGWRETIIEKIGAAPWRGVYSLAAFGGLAAIIWGYGIARQDTVFLYSLPQGATHLAMFLMLVSLILLVSANLPAGRIKQAVGHPTLLGTIIWSVAHLLVNGDKASIVLFGSLLVWAAVTWISAAKRDAPAPVTISRWSDITAIIGGAALWALIVRWLHEWLIGISVIA